MSSIAFRAIFAAALAPFFDDGILHKTALADDGAGGFTTTTVDHAIKVAIEDVSEKDHVASGVPAEAIMLTVLRAGLDLSVSIDDSLSVASKTYRVLAVGTDAAQASFIVTAVPL